MSETAVGGIESDGQGWSHESGREPVHWYSVRTWVESAAATMRHSKMKGFDAREYFADRHMQDGGGHPGSLDLTCKGLDEIWVDYVGDIGDGFDPAYSVLYAMQSTYADAEVGEVARSGELAPPGRILILGGDQVYPTPSKEGYRDRLVGPIHTAHPEIDPVGRRFLFSIPGNHDYYDCLRWYNDALLSSDGTTRRIGGYHITQRRSYWLLELPHHWLLVGVDLGEPAELDSTQERYLLDGIRAAAQRARDDGSELCVVVFYPTPAWLYGDSHKASPVVGCFEMKVREIAQIEMTVAGDRHCYIRHELTEVDLGQVEQQRAADPPEYGPPLVRLTAGNGGAFLHLPRVEPERAEFNGDQYAWQRTYPEMNWFKRAMLANPFTFVMRNPGFLLWTGLATAIAAIILAIAGSDEIPDSAFWTEGWLYPFTTSPSNWPVWFFVAIGILLVIGYFLLLPPPDVTGAPRAVWRLVFGAEFVVVILFVTAISRWLAVQASSWEAVSSFRSVAWGVSMTAIGAPALGFALGFVLWTHGLAGVSSTPVYGGARVTRHRAWLRFRVGPDGLQAFVYGIDRPIGEWDASMPEDRTNAKPKHPENLEVRLVDAFTLRGDRLPPHVGAARTTEAAT